MNSRKEPKQLEPGDQVRLKIELVAEVISLAPGDGDRVPVSFKPVPCSPECGRSCDCHFAAVKDTAPQFVVHVAGKQRLPFLGNLQKLLSHSDAISKQIARLQAVVSEPSRSSSAK